MVQCGVGLHLRGVNPIAAQSRCAMADTLQAMFALDEHATKENADKMLDLMTNLAMPPGIRSNWPSVDGLLDHLVFLVRKSDKGGHDNMKRMAVFTLVMVFMLLEDDRLPPLLAAAIERAKSDPLATDVCVRDDGSIVPSGVKVAMPAVYNLHSLLTGAGRQPIDFYIAATVVATRNLK